MPVQEEETHARGQRGAWNAENDGGNKKPLDTGGDYEMGRYVPVDADG